MASGPFMLRTRLGGLMFLQYFMMGAWFVPLGSYMSKTLHFDGVIGIAYGSQGIGAILSALLVGTLADRVFSTERLLAVLFLLSAATLCVTALVSSSVTLFLLLIFLHFLLFIPTIPLANALCFQWLHDATQFPRVRVLGTIGWIASGLLIGAIAGAAESRLPLLIGAGAGLALAAYALTLPHTPPARKGSVGGFIGALGLGTIARQADRSFWVLIGATLLIMLPMAFYYAYCNNFLIEAGAAVSIGGQRFEATAIQSLGQVSELVFLLMLPFMLRRFGIKGVFLFGIASWVVRYLLFAQAYHESGSVLWMLVAGVLLHGAANDFIQVAGQVYVDQSFPAETRARAQALFTTVLMGVGAVVGSVIANAVYASASLSATEHDWRRVWLVPAAAAFVTLIWFAISFRPQAIEGTGSSQPGDGDV